jgi:hypothetical protein
MKNLMIFHSMYDLLKFVKICLTIGCVNASVFGVSLLSKELKLISQIVWLMKD